MNIPTKARLLVFALGSTAALAAAGSAGAHAEISPTVVLAKHAQEYGLLVPTEKENATTTSVELTVPSGFAIDSFVPSPGWKRIPTAASAARADTYRAPTDRAP